MNASLNNTFATSTIGEILFESNDGGQMPQTTSRIAKNRRVKTTMMLVKETPIATKRVSLAWSQNEAKNTETYTLSFYDTPL
jgi:hypothetical protein